MHFTPGSLVKARGREWIVLPPNDAELLRLRPLTIPSGHEIGLYTPLETAHAATFADVDPTVSATAVPLPSSSMPGATRRARLPLYEAKMIHHYDHRWATYGAAPSAPSPRDPCMLQGVDEYGVYSFVAGGSPTGPWG